MGDQRRHPSIWRPGSQAAPREGRGRAAFKVKFDGGINSLTNRGRTNQLPSPRSYLELVDDLLEEDAEGVALLAQVPLVHGHDAATGVRHGLRGG